MKRPDFPLAEYERRLERLQRAMHDKALDAVFFTTEAEIRYFTGFRTLFWQSPARPWYLVIPKSGAPIAVIPEIGAALMATTWVDDIRTWSSPNRGHEGIAQVAAALENCTRIGMLMGCESSLRMSLNDFNALRAELGSVSFVDVSASVQAIRMVKSEAEIEIIAKICAIASSGFERAGALFHKGQTLLEVFRTFKVELLMQGAEDVPYLVGGAGPNGYADVISPPDEIPLMAGDVLMLDTGATLRGYFCDFDRNFAIGHAADGAKSAYRELYGATEAGLDALRPGVKCSELYEVMARKISSENGNVGRFGHGLGIQLTETPSIAQFDDTVLEAGMVITLEPSIEVSDGGIMVHEENVVVRDGPPQLLSRRAASELPIL